MSYRDIVKKRMMFIQKEDYNYLIYNLLLVLDNLKCYNETLRFQDFRKIGYLVDFIGANIPLTDYNSEELALIYSRAHLKKKLLSHALIFLWNKRYIEISINKPRQTFDIYLLKDNIPSGFLDSKLFENEIRNITQLKQKLPKLRTSSVKTLVDVLFTQNNVITWEV